MDAKKAAKVRKPFQFTKTKAFKAINIVFAGVIAYTALGVVLLNQYNNRWPKNWRDNRIDKYFESDEYLLNLERMKGKAPPSREQLVGFWSNYARDHEQIEGSRPAI